MSFPVIIFLLAHFFVGAIIGFIIRGFSQKKIDKIEVYYEALRIFYRWKSEIGGVSLKGVGQHYEKWILQKIEEVSANASDKTKKQPRKTT